MKTIRWIIIIICIFNYIKVFPQGVAINNTGTDPDASAMLDVSSTNSGILIPRMSQAQRDAISNPATGLMIYQTDNNPGFYYNSGTPLSPVWVRISLSQETVGGTGTATRVAFWSGTNTLGSNTNLYWDNTNSRLGIGTSTPNTGKIHIYENDNESGLYIEESNNGQGIIVDEKGNGSGIYITSSDNGSGIISELNGSVTTESMTGHKFEDKRIANIDIEKVVVDISSSGILTSSSNNIGLRVNVSGASNNYPAIFNGGNVGIGILSPQADLHINSNNSSGWAGMLKFTNQTTGNSTSDGSIIGMVGEVLHITNLEANNIEFNTENTTRWRIGAAGHLRPGITESYDIGSNSLRVKDYYGVNSTFTGNLGIGTNSVPTNRLHVNSGSIKITGSSNSNSDSGGMIIFDNSSGLGGGNAKMVVRRFQAQISTGYTVIYEDYAVKLGIYTDGSNYYICLCPKAGYNTWWDCNYPTNNGNRVNCSLVNQWYNLSPNFTTNYWGGSIYQINPNNTLGWPTYIVKVHLHSMASERVVTAIIEAYYP